jgi:hypothetical protein
VLKKAGNLLKFTKIPKSDANRWLGRFEKFEHFHPSQAVPEDFRTLVVEFVSKTGDLPDDLEELADVISGDSFLKEFMNYSLFCCVCTYCEHNAMPFYKFPTDLWPELLWIVNKLVNRNLHFNDT